MQKFAKSRDPGRGLLGWYPGSGTLGFLATSLTKELIALRNAVPREKWERVKELGIRCLGLGHGVRRILQAEFIARNQQRGSTTSSLNSFDEVLGEIAQGSSAAGFFGQLRQRLAVERPDLLKSLEGTLSKLEDGRVDGVSLSSALIGTKSLARAPSGLDHTMDTALACLAKGDLAIFHADFNLTYRAFQATAESVATPDVQENLAKLTKELSAGLRARQLAIYQSLASDRSPENGIESAEILAGFVERELPQLARSQAVARLASEILRAKDQGKAEAIGHLAMQGGALAREFIASHIAACRLTIDVLRSELPQNIMELISGASKIDFDSKLPNGKDTPVSSLDMATEGAFVEVEGFVTKLKVIRSGDHKLISQLQLTDAKSDTSASIAAIFTHLPHAGVTRDSFCRINGTFQKHSKLLGGKPGVEIDRLSEDELSQKIWRVAFIRTANRWFENWRNGTNMYWSIGPHRAALSSSEKASLLGAGEIIFSPFIQT